MTRSLTPCSLSTERATNLARLAPPGLVIRTRLLCMPRLFNDLGVPKQQLQSLDTPDGNTCFKAKGRRTKVRL